MGPLNNEDVTNPKTKNIRLYVKRVFISDDFDGELVSLLWVLSYVEISLDLWFNFYLTMLPNLFAVPEISELCEGSCGL